MASHQVLTDTFLIKHVTSFANGIPWPLYEFWLQYKPEREPVMTGFRLSCPVVEKLVQHGTLRLLELVPQVRFFDVESSWGTCTINETLLQVHDVLDYAIAHQRPEMLQWVITYLIGDVNDIPSSERGQRLLGPYRRKHEDIWKNAIRQFRKGDAEILDVLKRHLPIGETIKQLFPWHEINEVIKKDLELVQWLGENTNMPEVLGQIARAATLHGNLELVAFLVDRGCRFECDSHVFTTQLQAENWDLLEILVEHDLCQVHGSTAESMVLSEDDAVCKFVDKFAAKFQQSFDDVIQVCAQHRDVETVHRLLARSAFKTDYSISIDELAQKGKLKMITFLHERGLACATTDAMDNAAEYGHWDIVQFLHDNRSEGCTTRVMDTAAFQGNLKYVKFLLQNRSEGCTTKAMDGAATNRMMSVLRFLHENTSAGCTTDAMDSAAANGHLDAVTFLHTHRSEGCTVAAMNIAATNGHLDVVRFLHENRSEGCTVDAVKNALREHHASVLEYLRTHYPHFFGPELIHDTLLYGVFDLYEDLRAAFPEEANAALVDVAFQAGAGMELPTIRYIINVLKRDDVAQSIIDGASSISRHDSLWMRVVSAVTGVSLGSGPPESSDVLREHPFFADPRTPSWAVRMALVWTPMVHDRYLRFHGPYRYAVLAAYANDMGLLEVLRATPPDRLPKSGYHESSPSGAAYQFSFEDARAAAIRSNNLTMLQWMLEHVDVPVEPTLLSEAVYYHRYDIAEWLAENCPEACRETLWLPGYCVPWVISCGLENGLLEWLETHSVVRARLDFGAIIEYAVRVDDGDALETLYKWYPELIMGRPNLREIVKSADGEAIRFLDSIDYTQNEPRELKKIGR